MCDKLDAIDKWMNANGYGFISIKDPDSIDKIYNLILDNTFSEPTNKIEYVYYSIYYDYIKDYTIMIKYCDILIHEYQSSCIMFNLGLYYYRIKDFSNMLKYYEMAIRYGNSNAMNNLGAHYQEQKDYPNMIKYYEMAIENGCATAMSNLGKYYETQKDYANMVKYCEMSIANNCFNCQGSLESYYKKNKLFDKLLVLYLKTAKYDDIKDIICIAEITEDVINQIAKINEVDIAKLPTIIQYCWKLYYIKVKPIELHFNYTINGKGYEDAKKDFNNCLVINNYSH
jgi:hypothetical protein